MADHLAHAFIYSSVVLGVVTIWAGVGASLAWGLNRYAKIPRIWRLIHDAYAEGCKDTREIMLKEVDFDPDA